MFPYFGRKLRHASKYPTPVFDTIVEPFAGSLSFSLFHRPRRAVGIEADERVVELFNRGMRIGVGAEPMPERPEVGSKTDDLLVKLASYSEHGLTSGTMTVSTRMVRDWDSMTANLALAGAWAWEHVGYHLGSYLDAPDIEATWFIDPPYQFANRRGYRHGAAGVDFQQLAEWVRSRRGQVIVCEQAGADWLPFRPLYDLNSHRGSRSTEVVWTNEDDR